MRPKGARLQFALDQFKGAASNVTEVLACNPFVASRDTADAVRPWRDFLILPRRGTGVTLGHVA